MDITLKRQDSDGSACFVVYSDRDKVIGNFAVSSVNNHYLVHGEHVEGVRIVSRRLHEDRWVNNVPSIFEEYQEREALRLAHERAVVYGVRVVNEKNKTAGEGAFTFSDLSEFVE